MSKAKKTANAERCATRARDQIYQIRGMLLAIELLIENDDYKLYTPNPVEVLEIEIQDKLRKLDERLQDIWREED